MAMEVDVKVEVDESAPDVPAAAAEPQGDPEPTTLAEFAEYRVLHPLTTCPAQTPLVPGLYHDAAALAQYAASQVMTPAQVESLMVQMDQFAVLWKLINEESARRRRTQAYVPFKVAHQGGYLRGRANPSGRGLLGDIHRSRRAGGAKALKQPSVLVIEDDEASDLSGKGSGDDDDESAASESSGAGEEVDLSDSELEKAMEEGRGLGKGAKAAPATAQRRSVRSAAQKAIQSLKELSDDDEEMGGKADREDEEEEEEEDETPVQLGLTATGELNTWPEPVVPEAAPEGHEPCGVCGDTVSNVRNQIVLCDGPGCSVAVHQLCYGVEEIPEGEWLCDGCKEGVAPTEARCILCPVSGGALRQCTLSTAHPPGPPVYCHVGCALWHPSCSFEDPEALSDIRVGHVTTSRLHVECEMCDKAGGGVIECSVASCSAYFHVSCSVTQGGIVCLRKDGTPLGFCREHSKPKWVNLRTDYKSGRSKLYWEKNEPPARKLRGRPRSARSQAARRAWGKDRAGRTPRKAQFEALGAEEDGDGDANEEDGEEAGEEVLTDYERRRQEIIERNKRKMHELGL